MNLRSLIQTSAEIDLASAKESLRKNRLSLSEDIQKAKGKFHQIVEPSQEETKEQAPIKGLG